MTNKVSLFDAAYHVGSLLEKLDNGDDLDQSLIDDLKDAEITVGEAVDRRRYIVDECDTRISVGKKMVKDIREHLKKLERTKDKIKAATLHVMEQNPNQKYADSLGRKLTIRTSTGKISLDIPSKSVSVSNCVDHETAMQEGVGEYILSKSVLVLDMDKIGRDLKEGVDVPFATLDKTKFLGGI